MWRFRTIKLQSAKSQLALFQKKMITHPHQEDFYFIALHLTLTVDISYESMYGLN